MRHSERRGAALASGIGPDLYAAARAATRSLVSVVARRTGLSRLDGPPAASVAAEEKVSEIVDVANFVVSLHLPRDVLDALG